MFHPREKDTLTGGKLKKTLIIFKVNLGFKVIFIFTVPFISISIGHDIPDELLTWN